MHSVNDSSSILSCTASKKRRKVLTAFEDLIERHFSSEGITFDVDGVLPSTQAEYGEILMRHKSDFLEGKEIIINSKTCADLHFTCSL